MLEKDLVTTLLPQKAPFNMVENLTVAEEDFFESTLTITENNFLVKELHFSASGLVENIAQTLALGNSYFYHKNEQPPKIGFIAEVKNLQIHSLPKVGETITTKVTIQSRIFDFVIVKGETFSSEKIIASCILKVFIQSPK